jgi:disulfide bond formation protein DsbB
MKLATAALVLAIAGTIGSLFLSLGMGLKACPLCFYQRTFIMAAAAVLAIGLIVDRGRAATHCLMILPLAIGGLGVAAFHEYLVCTDVLKCPKALLGLGSAPAQSLAIFVALSAAALAAAWPGDHKRALGLALVVGLLLAWGSVASLPPLPPVPKSPYDPVKQPLDMCRPVFRGA